MLYLAAFKDYSASPRSGDDSVCFIIVYRKPLDTIL